VKQITALIPVLILVPFAFAQNSQIPVQSAVAVHTEASSPPSSHENWSLAEVYGGYSYLNVDTNDLTSRQSANGWETGVSGNFNRWFAAEAEFVGYYKNLYGVGVSDYPYGAGRRFNLRPVFFHALVGGTIISEAPMQDFQLGRMAWRLRLVEVCTVADCVTALPSHIGRLRAQPCVQSRALTLLSLTVTFLFCRWKRVDVPNSPRALTSWPGFATKA